MRSVRGTYADNSMNPNYREPAKKSDHNKRDINIRRLSQGDRVSRAANPRAQSSSGKWRREEKKGKRKKYIKEGVMKLVQS